MYHIKDNKRSLTSARALYTALEEMLTTNSLDDINISSLVKRGAGWAQHILS